MTKAVKREAVSGFAPLDPDEEVPQPLIILGQDDVVRLLPMGECIAAMEQVLSEMARGKASLPLRTALDLGNGRSMMSMPAALHDSNAFGIKIISVYLDNHGTPFDSHQGVVLLFNSGRGSLRLIADATAITALRTAAVSAVATKLLARPDAKTLAILGSGTQGRTHLEAMLHVRSFETIRVWSRSIGNASDFAKWGTARYGVQIEPMTSVEAALKNADVICTVTSSTHPILRSDWIGPGSHINAAGSSLASTRELDTGTVAKCRLFVDRRESTLNEAGDFLFPLKEGVITPAHIRGEIGDVLIKKVEGRQHPTDITLFKSLGIAVEDLAAAMKLHERALATDSGTRISFGGKRYDP